MTTAAHPQPQPQPSQLPIDPAVRRSLRRLLHETAAALQGPWRTEAAVREVVGTVAGVLTAAELDLGRNIGRWQPDIAAAMLATQLDLLTARIHIWTEGQRAAGHTDTGGPR